VKIHAVRPKGDLGDPIPIFLAERFAWVLRLKAVEPLALMVSIEKLAPANARIQMARSSAVEMTPPAAKA
jgi:hypothetical protein